MMLQQKKTGVFRGCVVPIIAVVGFIALCYLFCFVLYALNSSAINGTSNSGGMLLLPFN